MEPMEATQFTKPCELTKQMQKPSECPWYNAWIVSKNATVKCGQCHKKIRRGLAISLAIESKAVVCGNCWRNTCAASGGGDEDIFSQMEKSWMKAHRKKAPGKKAHHQRTLQWMNQAPPKKAEKKKLARKVMKRNRQQRSLQRTS